VLRRALTGHGVHWDPIEVRLRGERRRFGGNGMAAVARRRLLALLAGRAAESGVDLRFAAPTRLDDLLNAGYDLPAAGQRLPLGQLPHLAHAAHTAHFSVGSGTKMAMEDVIALAAAPEGDRTDPDTLDAALAVYENERGGPIARIQDAARPSLSWWEHFGRNSAP
jgi:hypothetical protein